MVTMSPFTSINYLCIFFLIKINEDYPFHYQTIFVLDADICYVQSNFFIYYSGILKVENIELHEVFASFWYALPLDIATTSYILIIPFLILLAQSLFNAKWLNYLNLGYTFIVLFAYIIITTSEIGIYDEWKTKLHYKALHYISNPDEIYNSASTAIFFTLISIFILQVVAGYWFYRRFVFVEIARVPKNFLFSGLFFLIVPSLLFLGLRGGISEIPITQSSSYFSKHNFVNLASINSGYSFMVSTMQNYNFRDTNPFEFL